MSRASSVTYTCDQCGTSSESPMDFSLNESMARLKKTGSPHWMFSDMTTLHFCGTACLAGWTSKHEEQA